MEAFSMTSLCSRGLLVAAALFLAASIADAGPDQATKTASDRTEETPAIAEIHWRHGSAVVLDELSRKIVSDPLPMPALVSATATWCAPCEHMNRTTFRDPRVIRAAALFYPVELDANVDHRVLHAHGVDELPTLLFLDNRGREIAR